MEGEGSARKRGRPASAGLAEKRREELTRAAFEVFVEYPYEDAPVSEIARRAGVGQGTLYRYVESKRELFDLVVDWCIEQLTDALDAESVVAVTQATDPTELEHVIDDIGARMYALADANPGLLRILGVQAGAVDRELWYRLRGLIAMIDALIVRVLTEATERGWFDLDPKEIEVLALVGPALGVPNLLLVADKEQDDPVKRAAYASSVSELAQSGLLARNGAVDA